MTQSIFIQVGQCGNQIGRRFWDVAMQEQQKYNVENYEENCFFRFEESKGSLNHEKIIKARALLVDMEESVIKETLRGPLRDIFDSKQLVTDYSGSGNNWAVGHHVYGKLYQNKIEGLLQKEVEKCDSLQCFFLLHSVGGGTGSGLGTAILDLLLYEYPKAQKFSFAVYPSACDDVVTSPYNAVLANDQLINNADCVFPIENEALGNMSTYIEHAFSSNRSVANEKYTLYKYEKPFDRMNNIVADLILDSTAASRFPGRLNVDLNELVLNLVPYPRLHYITSSMTPLFKKRHNFQNQTMTQIFSDLFSPYHRFLVGESRKNVCLACATMFRGKICLSDIQRTIDKLQNGLRYVPWNKDCFKIGLCNIPPINYPHSAVMLLNSSSVTQTFTRLQNRFKKMYKKKAHLHHFLQIDDMEKESFDIALNNLEMIIDEYAMLQYISNEEKPRLKVLV